MKNNNPSKNTDVKEKIKQSCKKHNTVGFTNSRAKNRGGNGKHSLTEDLIYDFMVDIGFEYNKAITTSEIRKLQPDKHFAYNYKPDFVNERKKICIEIDGESHKGDRGRALDIKKETALNYYGYKVFHYTNSYIKNNLLDFKKDIINLVGYHISKINNLKYKSEKLDYVYDIEVEDNHNYFAENLLVHNCKNLQSSQANGIMNLDKSISKMLMTGTLLVNNPYDLYCPMSICGLINYNKWLFERKFVIKDDWGQILGYQNMNELHDILYKSSIRRTKNLLDLPDKVYKQEWLELNKDEQDVFDQVIGAKDFKLDKIEEPQETVAIITRMRQATVASELLISKSITSTKFERLKDILEEAKLNNDKVLVFCPFTQALELGMEYCKEYNPRLIKGGMGTAVQTTVDTHENQEGFSVLFAQEATLGVGFTLTNTSIVVFLSPPWNRATYDQCIDRTHRIGQKKTVMVIDLLAKDTYDELIFKKLHGKGAMSDVVIDGDESEAVMKYIKEMNVEFHKKDIESEKPKTLLDGII